MPLRKTTSPRLDILDNKTVTGSDDSLHRKWPLTFRGCRVGRIQCASLGPVRSSRRHCSSCSSAAPAERDENSSDFTLALLCTLSLGSFFLEYMHVFIQRGRNVPGGNRGKCSQMGPETMESRMSQNRGLRQTCSLRRGH